MAFKLVGKNAAAQITLRGAQDGTPTALGTPAAFNMSLIRSIEVTRTTNTADLAGLGDDTEVIQVLRSSREITFEFWVPDSGTQFRSALGFYAQIDLKDLATMSTYDSYDGVITSYSHSYPDGGQTEKVTIRGAANGL